MRKALAIDLLLFLTFYSYGNALAVDTFKGLGVYSNDPVQFILTDPQGRQAGYDPVHNTWFHDIPLTNYSTTLHEDEQDPSTPAPPPMKALVMVDQMDGQYTLDVIGTGNGHFTVYVDASDAAGNNITQSYSGTTAPGVSTRFTFQGAVIIFAAFGANLKINSAPKAFEVKGTFTLGSGGAISPVTQPLTIRLMQVTNSFLVTIQAGSFRQTPQGAFVSKGVINGIAIDASLTPTDGNGYAFKIAGAGPTDLPGANPVEVRLAIGNNGGSVSVNADFAR